MPKVTNLNNLRKKKNNDPLSLVPNLDNVLGTNLLKGKSNLNTNQPGATGNPGVNGLPHNFFQTPQNQGSIASNNQLAQLGYINPNAGVGGGNTGGATVDTGNNTLNELERVELNRYRGGGGGNADATDFLGQRIGNLEASKSLAQQNLLAQSQLGRESAIGGLNDARGGFENRYADAAAQLQLQREGAAPQYQALRDENFINTLRNLEGINETTAQRGLFTGGVGRQSRLQERVAGEGRIRDVNLAEQQANRGIEEQQNAILRDKNDQLGQLDRAIATLKSQGATEDNIMLRDLEKKAIDTANDIQQSERKFGREDVAAVGVAKQQAFTNLRNIRGDVNRQANIEAGLTLETGKAIGEVGGEKTVAQQTLDRNVEKSLRGYGLDYAKTLSGLKTDELNQVAKSLANQMSNIDFNNYAEKTQLQLTKAYQDLETGNLKNIEQAMNNQALPEQIRADLENIYSTINTRAGTLAEQIRNNDFNHEEAIRSFGIRETEMALNHAFRNKQIGLQEATLALSKAKFAHTKKKEDISNPLDYMIKNGFAEKEQQGFTTKTDEFGNSTRTFKETGKLIVSDAEKERLAPIILDEFDRISNITDIKKRATEIKQLQGTMDRWDMTDFMNKGGLPIQGPSETGPIVDRR